MHRLTEVTIALVLSVVLAGCKPAAPSIEELIVLPTPTITLTPTATLPAPDLDELVLFVKGIEALQFTEQGWSGHFDVIHAAGGPVMIIVNLVPSDNGLGIDNAAHRVYPAVFRYMSAYMLEHFPNRQLRVLLTSVMYAQGPDGEVHYYQLEWGLTVRPAIQQKIVDGSPKAVGATPGPMDPDEYFWYLAATEIEGQQHMSVIALANQAAWVGDAIPTRTPVPTPRPTNTPIP